MDLREQIRRRHKDVRFIFGGLTGLLLILVAFYAILQKGDLPPSALTNRVLLFVLWYVNVILILAIVFVLVRTVLRLLVDRRNKILGSKFKSKLVFTAIALSLLPVLIIFSFANWVLLDSFDRWFDLPIEDLVAEAADTAHALSQQIEETNLRDAERVLRTIADLDLARLDQLPELQARLDDLRDELRVDYLAVYEDTEYIHGTADPRAGFSRDPQFRGIGRFLDETLEKGEAVHTEDSLAVDGRLILAARATDADDDDAAPPRRIVVAGTVLPPDLAAQSENLIQAYQQYLQLSVQRDELRANYLLILVMVTLLVVLAFSSITLRLARRITAPIKALADGTRRISSGDLDHRVVVAVDDELGVLVDAFNRMTEELQRNKKLVDRGTRELREASERLAAVLQNVAAGVVTIDSEGTVLTCNDAALEILAQRPNEVVGLSMTQAWNDPERSKLVELLATVPLDRPTATAQLRLMAGGIWKTLEVKVTRLTVSNGPGGAGGPTVDHIVVLEDLTELIHAQKMATWNEVARRIAHEIKNPLTPIRLTAERLLRKHRLGDPGLGAALEDGVDIIVREVASLKNMVDEFSRFARMPRPHPREIDLEKLLSETVPLYRGIKAGVEVRADVGPDARSVHFDPDQLRSVLINLLDNALEATEAPGEIVVRSAVRDGHVLLSVEDNGRGIPAEDKKKLFLPYFSTKGRGTGLGLSIVHRIVTDHNGSIHVEDSPGGGATFVLEVPAA